MIFLWLPTAFFFCSFSFFPVGSHYLIMPTIQAKHSPQDRRIELELLLSTRDKPAPCVTLGGLCRLAMCESPLALGGNMTASDIKLAADLYGCAPADVMSIKLQIDAGWRALECIVASGKAPQAKTEVYTAEWLMDMVATVCSVLPSATIDYVLWEMPWATACHVVACCHRRNGGMFERPLAAGSILDKLARLQDTADEPETHSHD